MSAVAIDLRLKALEVKAGKTARPKVAFVIWERSRSKAEAMLRRARDAGAVNAGDPVVMGVLPEPTPLPAMRWTDVLGMSDIEVEALGTMEGRPFPIGNLRAMADTEISTSVICSVARPAPCL